MIEFLRKFYKDREFPFLWHYVPALDDLGKPIPGTTVAPKFVLEIGSGKGAFLTQYALKFPCNYILGVEWDLYCARSAIKKLQKLGLENAVVIRGDLFYFLRDLMPANSIDEIHTYFPDPWPKRRQQKNRLILREGFLEQICRVLKPGKRIFYWATDHEEYNNLTLQTFRKFPSAKILEENTAQPTYGIETGFEKKYKEEGRKIYRSVFELRVESYKYRGFFTALLCVLLLLLPPASFGFAGWVGIPLFFAACFLRVWARMHIGEHSRGRELACPEIVKTGPYRYIRHPLYLSNFMAGVAFAVFHAGFSFGALWFCGLYGGFLWWLARNENGFLRGAAASQKEQSRGIALALWNDRFTWLWQIIIILLIFLRKNVF
ncbi:MAG: hypothetical protein LBQ87_03520 [Candidatus Fibromonas sp.]|nr:hypothetical protein [Candidatus Fibromonas sp.]